MFENEPDSEDDFEGYFLRPVNEYNIVDRIKDANKELFATPKPPSPSVLVRKVTFRDVLEDYETSGQDDCENHNILTESTIPQSSIESNDPSASVHSDTSTATIQEDSSKATATMSDCSDHEIEEICEEISSLDIETEATTSEKSDITEIEQVLQDAAAANQASTSRDRSSMEDLSTSFSQSSDDNLSVIVASYTNEDKKQKRINSWDNDDDDRYSKEQQSPTKSPSGRSKRKQSCTGDILKLRLNYKTCCEYKNAIDNLPRYSGYFSQYGLTKEQWDRKEKRIEKSRRKFLEKSCKTNEQETKKSEDNERAFTSWLRNKMRCPINKTKNMFDFKPNRLKRTKTKTK